jgi:methylated-DNA-[protein]-cysteine S-methyltransferase
MKEHHDYDAVINTPFPGNNIRLGIRVLGDELQELTYVNSRTQLKSPRTAGAKRVVEQLNAYFLDSSYQFSVPLAPQGTPYQKRVWDLLRRCPVGKVWSYGDLARKANSGPRAVGNACRRNPIPIVVPCHRIVSATGMGGYSGEIAGSYIKIKQWLLEHESAA